MEEINVNPNEKFDTNGGFDRERQEKDVLFELRPGQQGHFGRISVRSIVENARKRAYSMKFPYPRITCQILKPVKIRWINCRTQGKKENTRRGFR